ncbi:DUF2953 domain-containing protein [Paenibacillus aceris]|uniref:DUF2953 domain-containing protein n=1 Tax=Paenibacillus aceris TaxID=869555 RepID=A0ABS4HTX3_9BACL|nr:DUF2953 domain-containing protein [Paenibacillus aceris]MBP1962018.1 hypothetical protein [Paenibacillus aceris]NHW34134.1 DUF2953 domain-containing protein [Paenibacillus aceris]
MWVGLVLLVVILAIILVLVSFIRGEFYFSRVKDNDTLSVEMRALFGLIRYRYVIPIIQFRGFTKGILIKSEIVNKTYAKLKDESKDHITKDKVIQFYKEAKEALVHTLNLYDWTKQTLAKVECTELKWITRVGVGDAPETAITTGAIWGIKSSLLGFTMRYVQVKATPRVDVIPQFNAKHFSTEVRIAGRIRVWYVLFAGVRLMVRASKVKGGIRTWIQIALKARSRLKTAS